MQPRRTRLKKGLSAQLSSRCRRTWIVSTSSYDASSITRPCRTAFTQLVSMRRRSVTQACSQVGDDWDGEQMLLLHTARRRKHMQDRLNQLLFCIVRTCPCSHAPVHGPHLGRTRVRQCIHRAIDLAVCFAQVVVVRELLVRAHALVLAVLPRQRPVAVGRRRGGRRHRRRRTAALVAALGQAVVAVAVRAAFPLLPALSSMCIEVEMKVHRAVLQSRGYRKEANRQWSSSSDRQASGHARRDGRKLGVVCEVGSQSPAALGLFPARGLQLRQRALLGAVRPLHPRRRPHLLAPLRLHATRAIV